MENFNKHLRIINNNIIALLFKFSFAFITDICKEIETKKCVPLKNLIRNLSQHFHENTYHHKTV